MSMTISFPTAMFSNITLIPQWNQKDQAFFTWKSSYYATWCMPLVLRSYAIHDKWLPLNSDHLLSFVGNALNYLHREREQRLIVRKCSRMRWLDWSWEKTNHFSLGRIRRLFYPVCSQCTLFLPLENIRKPKGFLLFSGVREKVHWEQLGYSSTYHILI